MGMEDTEQPLINSVKGGGEDIVYRGEPVRWYVLALYSYLSALQSLLWMTFSSVPNVSRRVLHVDDATLNLLLDWGPIMFVVCVLWMPSILHVRRGFTITLVLAAVMAFVSAGLRCVLLVPSLHSHTVLAVLHVSAIVNASLAPLVVSSPAVLSRLFHPTDERVLATSIANVANAAGRGVGFFIGPWLAPSSATSLSRLLLVEVGLAAAPLLCILVYPPPPCPRHPPSAVAAPLIAFHRGTPTSTSTSTSTPTTTSASLSTLIKASVLSTMSSAWTAVSSSTSFLLVVAAGGLQMAVYGAWSGVLSTVLTDRHTVSTSRANLYGAITTFAGVGGGMLGGVLTDRPRWRRHLKSVVVVGSVVCGAAFLVLALALRPAVRGFKDLPVLVIVGVCLVAGCARGVLDPLFFEMVSHLSDAVSGGAVLTFVYHVLLCVSLSLPTSVLQSALMLSMAGCMLVCILLLWPVTMRYKK